MLLQRLTPCISPMVTTGARRRRRSPAGSREANPKHTGQESYNFFLNVLFSDHELRILPYNRVVKDLNEHTLDESAGQVRHHFEVGKANGQVEPKEPHQFGFYAAGQWYILQSKAGSFDAQHPIESIDAAILV